MKHTPIREYTAISERSGPVAVTTQHIDVRPPGSGEATVLCSFVRRRDADQSPSQVDDLLANARAAELAQILPTFAAATATDDEIVIAADALGFRHVYVAGGTDWAGVSTAARALSRHGDGRLDHEGLAVQSLLGWQLGQRTLHSGVSKLAPGTLATLRAGEAKTERFDATSPAQLDMETAVTEAAAMLSTYLAAFLDDHPDAILQLSGGLDSRILLSAIPPPRRRGLRVVTLGEPGAPDLEIAASLCRRFGMTHEVISIAGLEEIDDADAYARCVDAALRLDCTSDPLAHASLAHAESRAEEGPRLSGIGGEVARGFYYHGRDTAAPVTRQRADRLADWRLFSNESAEPEALTSEFGSWARDFAKTDVYRILADTGKPWFAATDELYLGHRMQRWGGITDTAVCMDRQVVNPMLDDRFLDLARRLTPADKRDTRFLSRLLLALDGELAAIPLDGRPAPLAYAQPSLRSTAQLRGSELTKYARKALQRVRRANRPPVGGEVLADKVVAHWRANPELLEPVADLDVFDPAWLSGLTEGRVDARSSSVAFLLNVLTAQNASAA